MAKTSKLALSKSDQMALTWVGAETNINMSMMPVGFIPYDLTAPVKVLYPVYRGFFGSPLGHQEPLPKGWLALITDEYEEDEEDDDEY